jgi:hypothetical protein
MYKIHVFKAIRYCVELSALNPADSGIAAEPERRIMPCQIISDE